MNDRPTDQQLLKLPKWARDYITLIEESERRARALVEEVRGAAPKGFFGWFDSVRDGYGKYHYLPKYATPVVFPDDRKQSLQLNVRNEGVLEVCAMHGQSIVVHPSCSNVILVESGDSSVWRKPQV